MRVSPLGNFILICAVASALASVLFMNLSWAVIMVAIATVVVYARSKFLSEIEDTQLQVERTVLDKMVFAGEPVAVKVEIVNKDVNPIYGTVEDLLPDGTEVVSGTNKLSAVIRPRTLETFSYTVTFGHRGDHKVGSLRVERTDPLGLFVEEQLIGPETIVNAHTRKDSFEAARRIAMREHFEYAGVSRMPAIVLREQEFDGIREYVPGDRARDILWKAYPKFGRLLTKTYIKEGSLQTMILMDCSRSMRIAGNGASKVDHAVDLSMQLSNVLLSNYHPTGIVVFDEVAILDMAKPSLGRHQFESIVRILRKVPEAIRPVPGAETGPEAPTGRTSALTFKRIAPAGEKDNFMSAVASIKQPSKILGVDNAIKNAVAKGKGQEQLFIVVSDLVSCRDAVVAGAKICQRTGNRMLVIHTYDDWYVLGGPPEALEQVEGIYGRLVDCRKMEAALRALGATYIRIGPADTASRIVRSVRRGMV